MYATVDDMISRFGAIEMTRFSVADGAVPEALAPARIEQALTDASQLIDSYLRSRYQAPVTPAPDELVRSCCVLARYDLAHGGDREPSEQMRLARSAEIDWLHKIATGRVSLEGAIALSASGAARVTDRVATFGAAADGGL